MVCHSIPEIGVGYFLPPEVAEYVILKQVADQRLTPPEGAASCGAHANSERAMHPDFIFVFNGNNTSIIRCFLYNQVVLLAGNNVIVFSPLWGAAGEV